APPAAVVLGTHVVARAQVALQHLQLLTVLETDDVVVLNRLVDRHRGLGPLLRLGRLRLAEPFEGMMDGPDQVRDGVDRHIVAADVGGDDFRAETHQFLTRSAAGFAVRIHALPPRPGPHDARVTALACTAGERGTPVALRRFRGYGPDPPWFMRPPNRRSPSPAERVQRP